MEDIRKVLLEAISIASRRKGVWQEVKRTAENLLRGLALTISRWILYREMVAEAQELGLGY